MRASCERRLFNASHPYCDKVDTTTLMPLASLCSSMLRDGYHRSIEVIHFALIQGKLQKNTPPMIDITAACSFQKLQVRLLSFR